MYSVAYNSPMVSIHIMHNCKCTHTCVYYRYLLPHDRLIDMVVTYYHVHVCIHALTTPITHGYAMLGKKGLKSTCRSKLYSTVLLQLRETFLETFSLYLLMHYGCSQYILKESNDLILRLFIDAVLSVYIRITTCIMVYIAKSSTSSPLY